MSLKWAKTERSDGTASAAEDRHQAELLEQLEKLQEKKKCCYNWTTEGRSDTDDLKKSLSWLRAGVWGDPESAAKYHDYR